MLGGIGSDVVNRTGSGGPVTLSTRQAEHGLVDVLVDVRKKGLEFRRKVQHVLGVRGLGCGHAAAPGVEIVEQRLGGLFGQLRIAGRFGEPAAQKITRPLTIAFSYFQSGKSRLYHTRAAFSVRPTTKQKCQASPWD